MLTFNELCILPDSGCLVIDVSILDQVAFAGCYITKIVLTNQKYYNPSGPTEAHSVVLFEGRKKHERVQMSLNNLNDEATLQQKDTFNQNDLFFVYVYTDIEQMVQPLDCGYDNCIYTGVVYNQKYLYDNSINYLKELEKRCKIPTYFIDWILKLKAFEIALVTCNYELAIDYWEDIISGDTNKTIQDDVCRCYS